MKPANGMIQRRSVTSVWFAGRAFTLIEIMMVVAIIAIVMTMGMPAIYRLVKLESFRQSVSDVMEACSRARAHAILQGSTMELVIRAEDGQITVQGAGSNHREGPDKMTTIGEATSNAGASVFTGQLGKDVGVAMLDVNMMNQMDLPESHVRFYPNGTSDELTLVLQSEKGEMRKITLEATTGLPDVEVMR
jgi:prepilin-type N-terminal cleavage/methylation domain-containing protein